MDVVIIDSKVWEMLTGQIICFIRAIDAKTGRDACDGDWLDNSGVCAILGVTKRTLQTYRDTGRLPHSQINHKVYYRREDIQAFLKNNLVKR